MVCPLGTVMRGTGRAAQVPTQKPSPRCSSCRRRLSGEQLCPRTSCGPWGSEPPGKCGGAWGSHAGAGAGRGLAPIGRRAGLEAGPEPGHHETLLETGTHTMPSAHGPDWCPMHTMPCS